MHAVYTGLVIFKFCRFLQDSLLNQMEFYTLVMQKLSTLISAMQRYVMFL